MRKIFFSTQIFGFLANRKSIICLILLAVIFLIFYPGCRQVSEKSPEKIRIAVFPFDKSDLSPENKWLGWGLEETIFECLKPDSGSPILVYDLDNMRKIIRLDSLADQIYLNKLAQKMKLDYFVSGCIISRPDGYQIKYDLNSTQKGLISTGIADFKKFKELHAAGLIIANYWIKTLPSEQNGLVNVFKAQDKLGSVYFFQAKELLFDNKIGETRQLLNRAMTDRPEDARNYALSGSCLLKDAAKLQAQGNQFQPMLEKAGAFLNTAVTLDSHNAKIRHDLAQYYIFTHNWIAAEKEVLKSYRINRNDPESYVLMSQLNTSRFTKIGFRNEIELLEYALFLNPGYVSGALSLSKYYVDYLQDPRAAIKVVKNSLAINPEQPDLLAELGRLYVMSGEFLEMMPVFDKLIKIAPSNSNAFYNLGIYYYNQKDYENAVRLFQRAIEIDSHLDAHLYLAYIYEQRASEAKDARQCQLYEEKAIENLRYRIKHKRDANDAYAETARSHLYNLFNK
jgi:tetratricopeptide (TPR) repeat protein